MGNPKTLICRVEGGSVHYNLYGGHGDSGIGFSTGNLQCTLPIEKLSPKETKEAFVKRIVKVINYESVCRVVKQVDCNVTF
jgi:hypothetical protein